MAHPATDTQVLTAYLFHCTAGAHKHAITLDLTAANLPAATCLTGWVFDGEVRVSAAEPLPFRLAPEPVLRGLRGSGYYVWYSRSAPTATTQ